MRPQWGDGGSPLNKVTSCHVWNIEILPCHIARPPPLPCPPSLYMGKTNTITKLLTEINPHFVTRLFCSFCPSFCFTSVLHVTMLICFVFSPCYSVRTAVRSVWGETPWIYTWRLFTLGTRETSVPSAQPTFSLPRTSTGEAKSFLIGLHLTNF